MTLKQTAHHGDILVIFERVKIDTGLVAAPGSEVAHVVVDVRDAPAHAGGEVAARRPDHHDGAVGHVFASVVAHAFNHRDRSGVAHREALAGDAVEKHFARSGAVEHHVAHKDALFRKEA